MRNLNNIEIHQYRDRQVEYGIYGMAGDDRNGVFNVSIRSPARPVAKLAVIASSDMGWDHVSVSHKTRTPKWDEMEKIKRMFFKDDETAMQLHVPSEQHINLHPHCLHLWRPHFQEIPRPPSIMVG